MSREPEGARSDGTSTPLRLCFLRGSRFDSLIGSTDRLIVPYFHSRGWDTHLVLMSFRRRAMQDRDGVRTWAAWTVRIPLVRGLVGNMTAFLTLCRIRPDVVVCNIGLGLAGSAYRWLRPRTFLVVDVRSQPVSARPARTAVHTLMFRLLMRFMPFDAFSVISAGMLEEMRLTYGLRREVPTAIWGSGVDVDLFDPERYDREAVRARLGIARDETVLVYHGIFALGRNLEVLPGMLEILREAGMFRLLLFGDGPVYASIRKEIEHRGLSAAATTFGLVPVTSVPELLVAADLGVIPLDGPQWENQSPMKLYEFLAMRLPVIATNLAAHRGISVAVQIVQGAPTADALAQSALDVLARDSGTLRQQARRDVLESTWTAQAKRLEPLLDGWRRNRLEGGG